MNTSRFQKYHPIIYCNSTNNRTSLQENAILNTVLPVLYNRIGTGPYAVAMIINKCPKNYQTSPRSNGQFRRCSALFMQSNIQNIKANDGGGYN